MTKGEALNMAIEQMQHLIKIYIPSPEWSGTAIQEDCYEVIQACKEALESQNIYKLALENILHGSLLDKHNRNDNGMIDAKRWSDTERHLDTWIKTAKAALDE